MTTGQSSLNSFKVHRQETVHYNYTQRTCIFDINNTYLAKQFTAVLLLTYPLFLVIIFVVIRCTLKPTVKA